jgi:hypothetical protein
LAEVFGFEFVDFEFKGDEALEFAVVEEEVDEEVAVADLEAIFLAVNKSESGSEFKEELFDVAEDCVFEVFFEVAFGFAVPLGNR